MNLLQKIAFALSTIALLSFDSSRHPFLGVEGAIAFELGVKCHPDAPDICYGEKSFWSPSPAAICPEPPSNETCETVYLGGFGWEYTFVKGLEEGITDPNLIEDAKTNLVITVTLEDDETTCKVRIIGDDCSTCSAEGCDFGQIKYDCTNLNEGAESVDECVAVDEFFYPYPTYVFDSGAGKSADEKKDTDEKKDVEDTEALSSKSLNQVEHFGAILLAILGSATAALFAPYF